MIELVTKWTKIQDKANERLAICKECDHFEEDNRCNKCGCYMNVKTKWPYSECPIGKWKSYEEDLTS